MFGRRRRDTPPAEPVEKGPDVYIESEGLGTISGGTLRFFFTEDLADGDTSSLETSLGQQLAFLRSFSFRPYRNYVALSWIMKDDDERYLDEVESDVQLVALGVLASHFGWREPETGGFHTSEERLALAKKLGVQWTLGRS
jgi:hypothetical protein